MTITAALPTYRGARHIAEALRSILAQDVGDDDFDLLICDDRSDDEVLDIARQVAGDRVRIEVNSERLGLAGNWNQCVKQSRAPWTAVFHQDDVMKPGYLRARLDAIRADPSLGMICGAAVAIDDQSRELPETTVERGGLGDSNRTFASGELLRELSWRNPIRCSTVALRAEAFSKLGGFDPSWRYVVDWDFWIKMGREWPVRWLAAPDTAFRWHLASETHSFKTGTTDLEETRRLLDLLFERDGRNWPDTADALRRRGWERLARAYLNRAYEASRVRQGGLVRQTLAAALELDRRGVGLAVLRDPRLAARLGWSWLRG